MAGYCHEFVTNFATNLSSSLKDAPLLGKINVPAGYIIDPSNTVHQKRSAAQDQFEKDAATIAEERQLHGSC